MQFTEKYIQSLKAKDKRYDVREKSGEGFAIRISSTNEKSWIFFYTFEGRKRRMTLGSYPACSLAEARKKHRDALKLLEKNIDPGLEKQKQQTDARTSITINDLIIEYIDKWATPRKRSWKEDKRILNKDIKPIWGKRKAKDITKRDVILLLENILQRAPIAANRTLACVRRMFNFAVERDILTLSPCLSVKALAKENRRDRCLSLAEINNFWHSLEKAKMSEATKLVLKFQLATAQRKGEILSAEWSEFDLSTKWWVIPANKAKNGYPHHIPLSELAIELLQDIKQLCNEPRWLFPSPTGKDFMRGESIGYAVRRSTQAFSDIKHFTPHDLRRTAATHMTAMGISRLVVSKILNHVDSSITAIYDRHSYDNEKRLALEAWGKKLKEIINDSTSKSNIIPLKNIAT